jgi:hypothetical protein
LPLWLNLAQLHVYVLVVDCLTKWHVKWSFVHVCFATPPLS